MIEGGRKKGTVEQGTRSGITPTLPTENVRGSRATEVNHVDNLGAPASLGENGVQLLRGVDAIQA